MSDSVSLKPLSRDPNRYQDVFLNAFCKIARKDLEYEEICRHFDRTVMKQLTRFFSTEDQCNILGVGVGEGREECHFVKNLGAYFTLVCNVAIDPSEDMLKTFQKSISALNSGDASSSSSPVVFHGFSGSLAQFVSDSPLAEYKYNLISSIHSIYYIGDLETTFTQLTSMLKDKGIMLIVCNKDNCILPRTFSEKTYLPTVVEERRSSNVVRAFAEKQGYDVITCRVPMNWDITDVFDEQSDFGNKLFDFFTQTAYFRQTVPAKLVDDLLSFWRSMSVLDKNGRIIVPADEEILIISK
nr:histamine N-methyltransferase-like [Lytechinus pictus]